MAVFINKKPREERLCFPLSVILPASCEICQARAVKKPILVVGFYCMDIERRTEKSSLGRVQEARFPQAGNPRKGTGYHWNLLNAPIKLSS
jgi:hypothetical protein